MKLHPPFSISSRLMPALVVGKGTISLNLSGKTSSDGRDIYEIWIDLPNGKEYAIDDLRSGCQGGTVKDGFSSLLSFLTAAAESRKYRERTGQAGENEELFPPEVVDWADENSDELSMLQCEIDENPNLIEED